MTSDVTWGTIWWGLVYAKRCWQQAGQLQVTVWEAH